MKMTIKVRKTNKKEKIEFLIESSPDS
ncbi:hypothetical protein NYT06_13480, partial [Staphylococcus aureus]|nr:hypothetical protein [Staphylococcus aureus]